MLALGIYLNANAQTDVAKLSPVTKAYIIDAAKQEGSQAMPKGYVYKKRADGKICISSIIQINASASADVQTSLTKINVTVGTKAGNIWTVQVPLEEVNAFIKIKGIRYIQIDEPVIPNLDVARKASRVDSVHGGYSLPMGYSGKDVIVGVIDFGFDYNHPTFFDTLGNKYRIVKAWEMGTNGTPPAGYSYGHEITDTLALKAQGTDNKEQTHGTGVAGLAAGSGYGGPSGGKYRGVAYESELVFVGVRRDSIGGQWLTGGFSDFIDGVSYLMKYAKSVGKPIVVNISWGSHSGPHDGSSLVNQAFDTLAGAGKIIVMSAGNNGNSLIHLGKKFTSSDTIVHSFLAFSSNAYKRTWIDIWGDTAKTFCVNTSLYSKGLAGESTGRICIDNTTKLDTLIAANGLDTCFVETITSAAEYNMKPRVTINIYNKATDSVSISVSGVDGNINMWNEYYYYGYTYGYNCNFASLGYPWAENGNTETTISDMGAGKNTLLIASYNSKTTFTNIKGIPLTFTSIGANNNISSYSSKGPYIDGRIRPDIAAPGASITTSCNSWDTAYTETGSNQNITTYKFTHPVSSKNYYFSEFTGTSASSPMAAGIIALMLQIKPTLTPSEVRAILKETAIKDFFTGTIPPQGSNTWGQGKINAYGAVRKLVKDLSIGNYSGDKNLDCVLFPNPNQGSFSLDYLATKTEDVTVTVTDLNGRRIWMKNWAVQSGQNVLPIDLQQVSKGIYFVTLHASEGRVSIQTLIQ